MLKLNSYNTTYLNFPKNKTSGKFQYLNKFGFRKKCRSLLFNSLISVISVSVIVIMFYSCISNENDPKTKSIDVDKTEEQTTIGLNTIEIPQVRIDSFTTDDQYVKINRKYVVTLNINISPDSLIKYCEFSADSGKTYQVSNIFPLIAGKYNFVARWKNDDTNIDFREFEFGTKKSPSKSVNFSTEDKINKQLPSISRVQKLLDGISNYDQNAYEKLENLFKNKGKVIVEGAENINNLRDLMYDCNNGNRYTVIDMQVFDNQVTIRVSK